METEDIHPGPPMEEVEVEAGAAPVFAALEMEAPAEEEPAQAAGLITFFKENVNFFSLLMFIVSTTMMIFLLFQLKSTLTPNPKHFHCDVKLQVFADGTGQGPGRFKSIAEAVDAAEPHSEFRTCIMIDRGEYHETITVSANKTNLAFKFIWEPR